MSSPETQMQEPLLDRPDRKLVVRGDGPVDPYIGKLALTLTGVDKPNMLIIPSPAPSHKYYKDRVGKMQALYENMGAEVTVLHGYGELPTSEEVRDAFDWADAYDITGGSTIKGVERMTKTGIRRAIKQFIGVGTGGSAGFNAHFRKSLSWDTPDPEEHPEDNEWRDVDGLQYDGRGIINAYGSPHADFIEGNFTEYPGENVYKGEVITKPRNFYAERNLNNLWVAGQRSVLPMGLAADNDSSIAFDGRGGFMVRNKANAVKHDGTDLPVGVTGWHMGESGLAVPHLYTPTDTFQPIANLVTPLAA